MPDASTVSVREFAESDASWDEMAAAHGTLFHTNAWLRVLQATQGAGLRRLGVYESGVLAGILPLFTKRYLAITVGASPFVVEDTPYLGLACDRAVLPAALLVLADYASAHGVHFLRMLQRDLNPADAVMPGAIRQGKHTHVLDLTQTRDAIWKGMEGKCRTGIRKAEKSGVTVTLESSRECIAPYYSTLSALYHAQGMTTPNSLEFYYQLWDSFSTRGLFVLSARHEGKLIAGGIFLKDMEWVYYLSGASLREYNPLVPNRAVQWSAIRHAQDLGARRYDFVGSDIPRLAEFKKSFGGALMTYTLIERASSPWVAAVRQSFPTLKRLVNGVRARISRRDAEHAS